MMNEIKNEVIDQVMEMDSFTTNVAGLLSEEEAENIAGVIIGVAYKDGIVKTMSYIANDSTAKDVFGTIASGFKKLLEVYK